MSHPLMLLQILLQVPSSDDRRWLIYGCAGLGLIYILFRYMGKKKRDPLSDSPVRFSLSQQKSVERDMQNLLVELSEMARQITAQIDTRSAKLELLIKEADEKMAELRRLTDAAPNAPRAADTFRLPVANDPSGEVDDPRHAEVYKLADQGKTSPQIAAELGRHSGEIELILALRGKRRAVQ